MLDLTNTYPCPECPTDCSDFELPDFLSDDCPDLIELELSEIKQIFIAEIDPTDKTKAKGGPSDWTDKTIWEASIDNATPGKVKRLFGIGDAPEGETKFVTIHDNQQKIISVDRLVNFEMQNMAQVNYDAMRKLQCGAKVRIWWITRGDFMYGGQNGVPSLVKKASSPSEKGADAYKKINFQFSFSAKCDPERIPSPWSESNVAPPSN